MSVICQTAADVEAMANNSMRTFWYTHLRNPSLLCIFTVFKWKIRQGFLVSHEMECWSLGFSRKSTGDSRLLPCDAWFLNAKYHFDFYSKSLDAILSSSWCQHQRNGIIIHRVFEKIYKRKSCLYFMPFFLYLSFSFEIFQKAFLSIDSAW